MFSPECSLCFLDLFLSAWCFQWLRVAKLQTADELEPPQMKVRTEPHVKRLLSQVRALCLRENLFHGCIHLRILLASFWLPPPPSCVFVFLQLCTRVGCFLIGVDIPTPNWNFPDLLKHHRKVQKYQRSSYTVA